MKKNIKFKYKIILFLNILFVSVLFSTNVHADAVLVDGGVLFTDYDDGFAISIEKFIGGDIYASSIKDYVYDDVDNINKWIYVCTADSRISGYCVDLKNSCNAGVEISGSNNIKDGCYLAITEKWDAKMKTILQAEVDSLIADAGVDISSGNSGIKSCVGDPVCINNVLASLGQDSSYAAGNSSGSNSENISDMLNSTGPINRAENNQTGILPEAPRVSVTFSSSGTSQSGSKMTANAVPSFFNNTTDSKKLYFTWFLQRVGCEENSSPNAETRERCDLDFNGKINENDWKIAAARINVSKNFDANAKDASGDNIVKYKSSDDFSGASHLAIPKISEKKANSQVQIGWANGLLPDSSGKLYDNNGDSDDVANCYVQGPKTGGVYELRKRDEDDSKKPCQSGYHLACVSKGEASCSILNPDYDQALASAATALNPYTEPRVTSDIFKACVVASDSPVTNCIAEDIQNFKSVRKCDDENELALCVKDDSVDATKSSNMEFKDTVNGTVDVANAKTLGVIIGTATGKYVGVDDTVNSKICTAIAKPDPLNVGLFLNNKNPLISDVAEECSVVKNGLISGTTNADSDPTASAYASTFTNTNVALIPKCEFKKAENLCKHLFPVLPRESTKLLNGNTVNLSNDISGDGKFSAAEKEFWGGNPLTNTTNGAQKDEEVVVGLGVDKFEWMFSPGDKVGVAVEGESTIVSDHGSVERKRMWALPNGGACKALELMEDKDSKTIGFYKDTITNKGILTAEIDLNDCLKENLLDPEDNEIAKIKIDLGVDNLNPINDPAGRGDVLNISSNTSNMGDVGGMTYTWSVQLSKDGSISPNEITSWVDVTNKLKDGGSFSDIELRGMDLKNLAINLNIKTSVISDAMLPRIYDGEAFYIRVKAKIKGSAADADGNAEGITDPIRVRQQQGVIMRYPVTANNDGKLSIVMNGSDSSSLCDGGDACYVSKSEIVGLIVEKSSTSGENPLSWSINGVPAVCNSTISNQCTSGSVTDIGNVFFFPVLGNIGEAIDVVAKGYNKKNEVIEISKHFVIGSSELSILTNDQAAFCGKQCLDVSSICPKYLGAYLDAATGGEYPDCSTSVWETKEGNTVSLFATGQTGFDWSVDGEVMPQFKDQNDLEFLVDRPAGSSYNIGLSTYLLPGNKTQLNNIRRALFNNWGVEMEAPSEENQSASIQIDVVAGGEQAVASGKSGFFGASLITNLPQELLFLLKISLTSVMLLLITGLLFAFIPENIFERRS